MLTFNEQRLLEQLLKEEEFQTFDALASHLGLSVRTVRNLLNKLEPTFQQNHLRLSKKYGVGIKLISEKQSFRESFRQAVINPNIIAAVIGMILFITQVKLPDVVSDPMNYIANLNTPLSMIVIGTNLGSINLKADWQDKLAWSGVFVRNLFFPIVILGILYALPLPAIAKMTTLIMATCPVAGVVVLFSLLSNFDVKFPTKLMCLSTLGAIITIPLVIFLATLIGL